MSLCHSFLAGTVFWSGPGRLTARTINGKRQGIQGIAHAVAPNTNGYTAAQVADFQQRGAVYEKWRKELIAAYTNSLEITARKGYKSIAFPFLGMEIYNTNGRKLISEELGKEVAQEAIQNYHREHPQNFQRIRSILRYVPTSHRIVT